MQPLGNILIDFALNASNSLLQIPLIGFYGFLRCQDMEIISDLIPQQKLIHLNHQEEISVFEYWVTMKYHGFSCLKLKQD